MATFKSVPLGSVSNLDKIVHAFFYLIFTILFYLSVKNSFSNTSSFKAMALSFFCAVLYGILIEIIQDKFTATRHADIYDVLANTTGATIAVLLIYFSNKILSSESKKISH
ncbi:VanZ family protein [Flavobacterium sp. FPG59]|uniref:VanZ family protein n=1 Tax=Flavobacterium sp. FPG59 TaxID=1929267 RepID=UPI001C3C693F|nr:VanZ family protein [Flavobacterium sp. FPG59]